jgi:GDP-6-deoxy-D-talose 4-dehydrogenase
MVAPIDMGKTILLTGADGFTGQHLTREARKRGYQILPLQSDLVDAKSITGELSGKTFEYVVHLAAISAVTHADELALYQVNLLGTHNLLQALSAQIPTPSKVIIASSANVYGNATESPINELATPAPVNHYAMSKLAMEFMLEKYRRHLPLVTVRPFNYTGVGHDNRFVIHKLVNHFSKHSAWVDLGNVSVEREFNDVRTVCGAYLDLLIHGVNQEVYNICSGKTYSLTQVVDTLSRLSGHKLEIRINPDFVRTNEVHRLCGDPGKLEACLGKLEHPTLEDTLQWMLSSAEY